MESIEYGDDLHRFGEPLIRTYKDVFIGQNLLEGGDIQMLKFIDENDFIYYKNIEWIIISFS